MAGGRPSKYDKTATPVAGRKLALLGLTDQEIADVMGVHLDTIAEWKKVHPEFSDALNEGKAEADSHVVDRLYQRAMGYEHDEVDIRVVAGEIVQTPIRRYYPPDTTAAIFWLKNRQRAKWRDKIETGVTDSEGKDVPPQDPLELARGLAFLLQKGANG